VPSAGPSHTPVAATAAVTVANEMMLINVQTGKRLAIAEGGGMSTENNVRALQFTCDSDPSRRWTLPAKL
jgi:cytolethal distending toxin subunit A